MAPISVRIEDVRPNVIIVLHDWEDNKRSRPGTKRAISRHPQADGIIRRRRAGATTRQLAADFGMSQSGMAETLRNRL